MYIRKSDKVIVIAGKHKGEIGRVTRVLPETNQVVIEGLNKIKRHTKPSQQNQYGGIVEKEAPLHASNVALVASDGKPTRVGFTFVGEGDEKRKVRISRRTKEEI